MRDFSLTARRKLARKGIVVISSTMVPGQGDLPCATATVGYIVNDNDCQRIWSFNQVMEAAR